MTKVIYALLLSILAQIIGFLQLQGQMAWKFPRENPYIMMFLGLPISLIFITTTKTFNEYFGVNWPGRLIGFGVGIIVFTIMSWLVFGEHPTPKTLTCLGLATIIVILQIFWK
jgi:multidrug transporter EmrE-like cation transporter